VIPEDLSKVLILSDMRQAIFTSRLRKSEQLNSMEFKWPIEKMGNRMLTPPPENQDVKVFEGADQQKLLWQRAQEFRRTPRVSKISEKVDRNVDLTKGKYDKLVTKKIKEIKRDMEMIALSTQDSAEDDGTVGSRAMGTGRFINAGELTFGDQLTAVPVEYRTPSAQVYTDVLANLTEDTLKTMLKSVFDNLGVTGEFSLFAGSTLKGWISDTMGNYRKEREGYGLVVRTDTQSIDRKKVVSATVDIYESEFGTFDIEISQFIGWDGGAAHNINPYMGYGVDLEQEWEMRPLFWCEHTEFEYRGGGRSGLVESILSWKGGDPRKAMKIAPSDAATQSADGN